MNSRERLLAAWNGQAQDHLPLTTWCFGFHPADEWRWQLDGAERTYWYSMRLEHIHTLPQPWTLEDEFRRVTAWRSLGLDDLIDVSVPWSINPEVTWEDNLLPPRPGDPFPAAYRLYRTPSGDAGHIIRLTGEKPGPGWVIQPQTAQLFEDYNIPRGIRHLVASPEDIPPVQHLFRSPDTDGKAWFKERMERVSCFAEEQGVAVQAWAAFGMDAVVWLAGVQNAILLALDEPAAFQHLVDIVFEADYGRVELAAASPGVDLIVQRGWYSSTDFWSPKLFERFTLPHLAELAYLAHRYHKKFAYVMTTGVKSLGPRLAEAGVDVLYFADPVQDRLPLEWARDELATRMTLAGGINTVSLCNQAASRVEQEVRRAIEILGATNRFILHPVDALFPDTPLEAVERVIAVWKQAAAV